MKNTNALVVMTYLQTEKSAMIGQGGAYVFAVPQSANKIQVAKTVESVFGVKPAKVNMVSLPGKIVSRAGISGRRAMRKKAYVMLPAGKTLDLKKIEGVKPSDEETAK